MESTIYAKLSGDSGITALVSTRIYPVEPSNDTQLPYIVYTRGGTEDFLNLSGNPSVRKLDFIIDYWAINLDTCLAIGDAVYSCLQGWRSGNVQGTFRQSQVAVEEQFGEGTAFHGNATYAIYTS